MTELAWGASTHVGHSREINEDSFVAEAPVFMVADGMGGHERGEVASGLVADEFAALAGAATLDPDLVTHTLRVAHAHVRASHASTTGREMGTTLAALVLVRERGAPQWLLANVGDSRIYRFADGRLEQLSVDHSVVQELIAAGEITTEAARTHPDRNVITRALGLGDVVTADYALRTPETGERYLLCSDGLHGELTEGEILDALRAEAAPQQAAAALVEAVLAHGAHDNLTAVVVDVVLHDEGAGVPNVVDDDTGPPRTSSDDPAVQDVDPTVPAEPSASQGEREVQELVAADKEDEAEGRPELIAPPPQPAEANHDNDRDGVEDPDLIKLPKW